MFFSGKDDRNLNNFAPVTMKEVEWTTEPPGVTKVDRYGRVDTLKVGECVITVESLANPGVKDSIKVKIVQKREDIDTVPKRVINYEGGATPEPYSNILQKIVERFSSQQIQSLSAAPENVKKAALKPDSPDLQKEFTFKGFKWEIKKFANGSENFYVLRTDTDAQINARDKCHYFMGDRYLPEDGKSPIMIETDTFYGAWVVSKGGSVNHIVMRSIGYE